MLHSLTLKHLNHIKEKPLIEICLLILFGLISYSLSEVLELSGIITILTCAVIMNHYSYYNMSA